MGRKGEHLSTRNGDRHGQKGDRAPGQRCRLLNLQTHADAWGVGEMFRAGIRPVGFQIMKRLSQGSPATSQGFVITRCSTTAAAFNGRSRPANHRQSRIAGCSKTGGFITPTARQSSCSKARCQCEPPTPEFMLLLTGAAQRGNGIRRRERRNRPCCGYRLRTPTWSRIRPTAGTQDRTERTRDRRIAARQPYGKGLRNPCRRRRPGFIPMHTRP